MTAFTRLIGLVVALSTMLGVATAGMDLTVSTAGLGEARFGMDVESVERAIGRKLVPPKGKAKAQMRTMVCSYASVADLVEVSLRFEKGRFIAIDIGKPNVTTRSGFKVGDLEQSVIEKLKGDPTYRRENNHYEDAVKEITVGKLDWVDEGQQKKPRGYLLKFTSKKGRITHIQAGDASYVSLFEHDEDCDS